MPFATLSTPVRVRKPGSFRVPEIWGIGTDTVDPAGALCHILCLTQRCFDAGSDLKSLVERETVGLLI